MPLLGIPETDDGFDADWGRRQFFAGFWPPAPIVAGGKPLRALMRAQLVQFIRPHIAAVCQTRIEQIGNHLGIAGKPLTLEKRAFPLCPSDCRSARCGSGIPLLNEGGSTGRVARASTRGGAYTPLRCALAAR